jgi:hypothetical protein
VGEALCVAKKAGLDMKLVYDAMRVRLQLLPCLDTALINNTILFGKQHSE